MNGSTFQAALACGEAFQKVAEPIIAKIPVLKPESSDTFSSEIGDLVVCAACLGFAIELYLKALLMQLKLQVPRTHDLRILYDAIPPQIRELIERTYDLAWPDQLRCLSGHISITIAKGPLKEPRWSQYAGRSLGLPEVLARSKDLFQSWRYIFEFKQGYDSLYQFHEFEYGLLWCVAEALRVETKVRMNGEGD